MPLDGDFSDLDDAIAHLERLEGAVERAAARAAPEIQRSARAGYATNTGPGGVAWEPNKDGRFPSLARPASEVTFTADRLTLRGHGDDVLRYHMGSELGGNPRLPARAVFPQQGDIPFDWALELDEAFLEEVYG